MDCNIVIAGNGMGRSNFANIPLDTNSFDMVICDKSFEEYGANVYKIPYKDVKDTILNNIDKKILYVVTGSVSFYSAGSSVIQALKQKNIQYKVIDNISSKSYLLANLGISDSDVGVVSLHGRDTIDLGVLFERRYTYILCDEYSIQRLQIALQYIGTDEYTITLAQRLGYDDEQIININLDYKDTKMPYSLLIEKKFVSHSYLSDTDFQTQNGMITKQTKRDLSISALQIEPNMRLLDIGAGSGSVSICAYLRHKCRCTMVEKNKQRADNIIQNLQKHKVVDANVIVANICDILDTLGTFDRVFIGGGGSDMIDSIDNIYAKLSDNGIIIANFVTLTNLTQMIINLKVANIPFDIKSISIDNYQDELLLSNSERMMYMIRIKK